MTNSFFAKLAARWEAGARVCVGLDSQYDRLPQAVQHVYRPAQQVFNENIIDATKDLALAYKPNLAFYSNEEGLPALVATMAYIREFAPDVPVILDSKDADIGNTNVGYVDFAFDRIGADAVTTNPYLGGAALAPLLSRTDKGVIVICRTSNPGSDEFQNLMVGIEEEGVVMKRRLYEHVAREFSTTWNTNGNCSLVVGATYPQELGKVRNIVGDDMWLLIPGIGTQGGDLDASVRNGITNKKDGIIINSSSGIIFASKEDDYAEAARKATQKLTNEINTVLATI